MASFNKIIIVGHLGRDPELRTSPSGTSICDFSLATSERRGKRDGNGKPEEATTWFRVTFWGRQAEVAHQYLSKGKQVYVEGRLSQREWTDRDGIKRTSLEVRGSDVQFMGTRADETGAPPRTAATGGRSIDDTVIGEPIVDDDIPF